MAAAAGAAVLAVGGLEPWGDEAAPQRSLARRIAGDGSILRSISRALEERALESPAETVEAPAAAAATTSDDASAADPEDEASLDEELRRTEQALAESRRHSGTDAGEAESSRTSREARAAAAAGSFAAALGCAGAGHACRSSAECCPGLACAGGIAGYGTVGRCEGAR